MRYFLMVFGLFYFAIGMYGQFFATPKDINSPEQAGQEHYIAIGLLAFLVGMHW
jgi:hypothetical protein